MNLDKLLDLIWKAFSSQTAIYIYIIIILILVAVLIAQILIKEAKDNKENSKTAKLESDPVDEIESILDKKLSHLDLGKQKQEVKIVLDQKNGGVSPNTRQTELDHKVLQEGEEILGEDESRFYMLCFRGNLLR